MNELDLLKKLKQGLLDVNANIKDTKDFFGNSNKNWKNSEKAQNYYLWKENNNLYKELIPRVKLGTGSKAVRSSAAMIYNTLYNGNIIIDKQQYAGFKEEKANIYEIPFPAIKDDRESTHTAKLDAGLISCENKELLLFEAKCMEWFDKNPKGLKKAYLNKERYFSTKAASLFIPLFSQYIDDKEVKENGVFVRKPMTVRYDAIQMLIHCLGIFNWCMQKQEKKEDTLPSKIRLLNLVWDYKCGEYDEEEKEGYKFESFINNALKNQLDVDFSVEYIRYSDFLNRVDWTNDVEHRNYLKRYKVK